MKIRKNIFNVARMDRDQLHLTRYIFHLYWISVDTRIRTHNLSLARYLPYHRTMQSLVSSSMILSICTNIYESCNQYFSS